MTEKCGGRSRNRTTTERLLLRNVSQLVNRLATSNMRRWKELQTFVPAVHSETVCPYVGRACVIFKQVKTDHELIFVFGPYWRLPSIVSLDFGPTQVRKLRISSAATVYIFVIFFISNFQFLKTMKSQIQEACNKISYQPQQPLHREALRPKTF